jgi:hypothetical protein
MERVYKEAALLPDTSPRRNELLNQVPHEDISTDFCLLVASQC